MSKKLTTDLFIEKAIVKHGNKYDYSKVKYKDNKTKVEIICPKHGSFWQTPKKHLYGQGCPKCKTEGFRLRRLSNTKRFSELASQRHNNKYNYSLVEYVDQFTKVKIICPEHGVFTQEPRAHIRGQGCPVCGRILGDTKRRIVTENFIKRANKIHNNKYLYNKTNCSTCREKVIITCPKHGDFWQVVGEHLKGAGCPKCNQSKGEAQIEAFLKERNINYTSEYRFKDCRNKIPLPFDFAVFDKYKNLLCLIEYQGKQHFEPVNSFGGKKSFEEQQKRDKIKRDYCKRNNIKLYIISYKEDLIKKLEEIKEC